MASKSLQTFKSLLEKGVGLVGTNKRPIVIHFDVNRTIIQIDPAGGKALADVLNNNLASQCWGAVDNSLLVKSGSGLSPNSWKPFAGPADPAPTVEIQDASKKEKNMTLMTYDNFVDEVVVPSVPKEVMATLSTDEGYKKWDEMSKKRRALKNTFSNPGQPGEQFKPFWEKMHQALQLQSDPSKTHFIIPAMWDVVNTLSVLEWPFSIVIRTFGNDCPEILHEWRKFIFGELEVAPQGPMLAALKTLYEKKENEGVQQKQLVPTGCVYRSKQGTFLKWGPAVATKLHKEVDAIYEKKKKEEGDGGNVNRDELELAELKNQDFIQLNPTELYKLLALPGVDTVPRIPNVTALVDFYPFWSANGEHPSAGKLYPVFQPRSSSPESAQALHSSSSVEPFQVFFDDNVFVGEEESIIDVKDAITGDFIAEPVIQNRYMCQVAPYKAIMNCDYFALELATRLEEQHKDFSS